MPSKLTLEITFEDNTRVVEVQKDHILIGRPDPAQKVDVNMMPDRRVSRQHVELYYEDGVWWAKSIKNTTERIRGNENATVLPLPTQTPVELLPGDVLMLGESMITVDFDTAAIDKDIGGVPTEFIDQESAVTVPEVGRPDNLSERMVMEILPALSGITQTQTGEALLELCLEKINDLFGGRADHLAILLRKDKELAPYASIPRGHARARFSYTLARYAIQEEKTFCWRIGENNPTMPKNVTYVGILQSIYAPMIFDGEIIGVIHAGITNPDVHYSQQEITILGLIANNIAQPIRAHWNIGTYKADRYPQVFISYSRKDTEFIKKLADDLRRWRIRVWFDEQLDTGESWRENLAIAIQQAHAFVLVMSPDSVDSQYVQWEIELASNNKRKIFPVMYRKTKPPIILSNLHYTKLQNREEDPDTYEQNLRGLVRDIKNHGRDEFGLEV